MTITRLTLTPELTVKYLMWELCKLHRAHINGITTLPVASTHPCMHENTFAWSYIVTFVTVLTACYGYEDTLSSLMQKQWAVIVQNKTVTLNGCRKHHDIMMMLSIMMRQAIPCDCWFNTSWRLISSTVTEEKEEKSIYTACVKSDNFILFDGIYR